MQGSSSHRPLEATEDESDDGKVVLGRINIKGFVLQWLNSSFVASNCKSDQLRQSMPYTSYRDYTKKPQIALIPSSQLVRFKQSYVE